MGAEFFAGAFGEAAAWAEGASWEAEAVEAVEAAPSGVHDLGQGNTFTFEPAALDSLMQSPEVLEALRQQAQGVADFANANASESLTQRAVDEGVGPLYVVVDDGEGAAVVVPGNFFGELDEQHNSTLAKAMVGFDGEAMTPAEAEALEATAHWQNDEGDGLVDPDEEVQQYRDRPVRRKPTRDLGWTGKGPGR